MVKFFDGSLVRKDEEDDKILVRKDNVRLIVTLGCFKKLIKKCFIYNYFGMSFRLNWIFNSQLQEVKVNRAGRN